MDYNQQWDEQQQRTAQDYQRQDEQRQQQRQYEASQQESSDRSRRLAEEDHWYRNFGPGKVEADRRLAEDEANRRRRDIGGTEPTASADGERATQAAVMDDAVLIVLSVPFYPLMLIVWVLTLFWTAAWTSVKFIAVSRVRRELERTGENPNKYLVKIERPHWFYTPIQEDIWRGEVKEFDFGGAIDRAIASPSNRSGRIVVRVVTVLALAAALVLLIVSKNETKARLIAEHQDVAFWLFVGSTSLFLLYHFICFVRPFCLHAEFTVNKIVLWLQSLRKAKSTN